MDPSETKPGEFRRPNYRAVSAPRFSCLEILKFFGILFVGYIACLGIAVVWAGRGLVDGFTLHGLSWSAKNVLALGFIPITLVVASVTLLSIVLSRRHPGIHLAGCIAVSLIIPTLIQAVGLIANDPDAFYPVLFIPAVGAAIVIVFLTRSFYCGDSR